MKYFAAAIIIFFSTAISTAISVDYSIWFNLGYIFSALMLVIWAFKSRPYIKNVYETGDLTAIYRHGILILILLLLHLVITGQNIKLDLSSTQKNSLAPKTQNILLSLDDRARLFLFMKQDFISEGLRSLLELLGARGNNFDYTFIDPDIQPAKATEMGVKRYNTLILEYKNRREILSRFSEAHIASALIRMRNNKIPLVLFTAGSGEKSIDSKDESGIFEFAQALENEGIETATFFCGQGNSIPDRCELLIIAGPDKKLKSEAEIQNWVANGKSLMVLCDPPVRKKGLLRTNLPDLNTLVSSFGLVISDTLVIDQKSKVAGGEYFLPYATDYPAHAITADLQSRPSCFSMASAVFKRGSKYEGFKLNDLIYTSKHTWAETEYLKSSTLEFDPARDFQGPFPLAIIAEKTGQCCALFGDSDFISNRYINNSANREIAVNCVNHILGRTELVALSRKKDSYRGFVLKSNQSRLITLISALFCAVFFSIAAYTAWSRRV